MRERNVKKVLVGADTVYANGDVINKIGTSLVALAAKNTGIEFIVATESIKFSPASIMGATVEIEEREAGKSQTTKDKSLQPSLRRQIPKNTSA